ncbi:unnamed protein product, partial [marine sediment metagenome]
IKEYKKVICAELAYLGIFWRLVGLSYKNTKKNKDVLFKRISDAKI